MYVDQISFLPLPNYTIRVYHWLHCDIVIMMPFLSLCIIKMSGSSSVYLHTACFTCQVHCSSVLCKTTVSSAVSHNDVIESANAAQPLPKGLADSGVGHMTGELAEAGVECRLEGQEGWV